MLAPPLAGEQCKSQESSLALLWTLGIFTLNCGPVVMGLVLDFIGPKLTGILGGGHLSCRTLHARVAAPIPSC